MERTKIIALAAAMAIATWSGSALADGDPAKGEKVFRKCKTCHSMEAGKHKIGPSLAGIVGRQAGTVEGYTKYSDALKGSGITWDEDNLEAFLEKPKEHIPGNKMTFPGLRKEDDREDVIAYLKSAS